MCKLLSIDYDVQMACTLSLLRKFSLMCKVASSFHRRSGSPVPHMLTSGGAFLAAP